MKTPWKVAVLGLVAVFSALILPTFFLSKTADAANPATISFQGKVVNSDGTNVADRTYPFSFSLYTTASGGTAIWTESDSVSVVAGTFQVNLGANCSFFTAASCNNSTPIDFSANPNLYLGITFNNDTAGEMTPRPQLQSVPFAFQADNASKLGGVAAANYAQLAATGQQTGSINVSGSGTFGNGLTVGTASVITSTDVLQNVTASTAILTSGTLGTARGGTGLAAFTANSLLYASSTSVIGQVTPGTSGQLLVASGTGVPTFVSTSGDVTISNTGAMTIGAGKVTNADLVNQSLTVNAGTGLSTTSAAIALGGSATISLANTTVTGGNYGGTGGMATFTVDAQGRLTAASTVLIPNTALANQGFTTSFGTNLSGSATVNLGGVLSVSISPTPTFTGVTTGTLVANTSISTGAGAGTQRIDASGNLTNIGTIAAAGGTLNVNSLGDQTAVFTQLDGSTTTNGTSTNGFNTTNTTLTVASTTNFNAGNYVQISDTNCGGTGINPCYAKISSVNSATQMTITPALTWTSGKPVVEYHIPELGGTDLTKSLNNRYGLGYFIAGVATGEGTTYYSEDGVTSSLSTYNFLPANVTTLNIGAASTNLTLGSGSSTINIPGTLNALGSLLGSSISTLGSVQGGSLAITGTASVGSLTNAGTYNGNVLTSSALGFSSTSTANSISGALGQSLTIQTTGTGSGAQLNLGSASGTLGLTSGTGTIQQLLSSGLNIDLSGALATMLTLKNSGVGSVANFNIASGSLYTGSIARLDSSGNLTNIGTITASGLITANGGVNVNGTTTSSGLVTANGGLTVTGGAVNLNVNGTAAINIGTGTLGTSPITIGGGLNPFSVNSTNFDLSTGGALSGITTISASGAITGGTYNGQTFGTASTFTGSVNGITTLTAGTINATTAYQANGTAGGTITCPNNDYLNSEVTKQGLTISGTCAGVGLSDQRLKTDIVSLDDSALDSIKNVNAVNFYFDCSNPYFSSTNTYCNPTLQTGVIAQQISQIFPQLVTQDQYGYYRVDYQGLSVETLKAVSQIAQFIDSAGDAAFNNLTVNGTLTYASTTTQTGNFTSSIITPSLLSSGALAITAGSVGDVTVDTTATSANVNIGTTNAANVNISHAGAVTNVNGALKTLGDASFAGNVSLNFSNPSTTFTIDNGGSSSAVASAISVTDTAGKGYVNILSAPHFNVAGNGDVTTDGLVTTKGGFQILGSDGTTEVSFDTAGNATFAGNLNLASASLSGGLTVGGDVNIAGLSTFQKMATFFAKTVFKQDVEFQGHLTVAADTAGYASLRVGESTVHVAFKDAYDNPPVVSAAITNGVFGMSTVNNVTDTGFDITMATPALSATTFSWTAVGVNNPQTATNPLPITNNGDGTGSTPSTSGQ